MTKNRITVLAVLAVVVGSLYFVMRGPQVGEISGEPIVDVRVPRVTADLKEGENLFNEKCASCHGQNAVGKEGVAPPLVHKIYQPGHHADGAFLIAAKYGARQHHWRFGSMPPVRDISEAEVTRIVAYVRALQRANGIN